jgi:hypothetical protein
MSQHEGAIDGEGSEYVCGATVHEIVKAMAQGLAIDRHETPAGGILAQCGGMTSKYRLDRCCIELSYDAADRGVCWRFTPLQAEHAAEPREVNLDKAVDGPV